MKRTFVLASCGEAEVPSMPETGLEPARAWLAHQPLKLARLPILPLWDGEESPRWRHSDHASGNLGKSRQSRFEASPPSVLYRKPEVQKFRGHHTQFPASVPMNYVWCPRNSKSSPADKHPYRSIHYLVQRWGWARSVRITAPISCFSETKISAKRTPVVAPSRRRVTFVQNSCDVRETVTARR